MAVMKRIAVSCLAIAFFMLVLDQNSVLLLKSSLTRPVVLKFRLALVVLVKDIVKLI